MGKMSFQGSQDEILKHAWMTKRYTLILTSRIVLFFNLKNNYQ